MSGGASPASLVPGGGGTGSVVEPGADGRGEANAVSEITVGAGSGAAANTLLRALRVRDFRNIAAADLEFPEEGVVLVGANGQGKTSLLESIRYLSILRSARGSRDADLVRHGEDAFFVGGSFAGERELTVSAGFARGSGEKRVVLDSVPVARLADAFGVFPATLIAPGDSELVWGAPGARRRYLDVLLSMVDPSYLAALQMYRGALLRRNAQLRVAQRNPGRSSEDGVAVWEKLLGAHGAVLWEKRLEWLDKWCGEYSRLCREAGEGRAAHVALTFSGKGVSDAAGLERLLADGRGADIRRGRTGIGPHCDDLCVTLDGRELRTSGSGGEQRTAAVVLRLLESATVRAAAGRWPVMLMDDPFAELDEERAGRILGLVHGTLHGQVALAVPRNDDIPPGFTSLPRWRVSGGAVEV